jgi:short-subunit dehydrogenase
MMTVKLRKLRDQTIVVTGASSGIGLVTARMAAAAGARVMLTARNERALRSAVQEIRDGGGEAEFMAADVADAEAVERVAERAVRTFGGFDSWINNASASIYGRLTEVDLADKRRLMDVNFWGAVHGCRVAVPQLIERARGGYGGAIVNVGSALSDRAIPLQGIYCATKHALKAYTESLRMELEEDGAPISVSLVKPASIDTPFYAHARNYMDVAPRPIPPVYAPEVVARAILRCTERPTRDVFAGAAAKAISSLGQHAPRTTDRVMERALFDGQRTDRPASEQGPDNLWEAGVEGGDERLPYDGHVAESSAYTRATLQPRLATLVAAGIGLALAAGLRNRSSAPRSDRVE